ncbi:MAG: class I SAM-dependent methyltransferase [Sphingomicrobium sp.]
MNGGTVVLSKANRDDETIRGFGLEWNAYDQTKLTGHAFQRAFDTYFELMNFDHLPQDAEGFDLGCGSGRWAAAVAPRVKLLHCIDPSEAALDVARRRLSGFENVRLHLASSDEIPLEDASQDFGYSLGVLHHIPDTGRALWDCVRKLKPGAPFLLYIYYALENRPPWYRAMWRASEAARYVIARSPFAVRRALATAIAGAVYWPLARTALAAEALGADVTHFPLSIYRFHSFYTMRTDALDRFGTRLEQRFTRAEIKDMMEAAGLADIRFGDRHPFWIACGRRS